MTVSVSEVLAHLHLEHDMLAAVAASLTDEQLTGPSGASEWRICDVLSHLGSGAEIGNRQVTAALGTPSTDAGNEAIWERWNALSPVEQANGYVAADQAYLDTLDGITEEQQASLQIDMGFMPHPVPLILPVSMRLNEVVLHGWDVNAGLDENAEVDEASARVLLSLFADPLAMVLGFAAKPAALGRDARIALPDYTLHVFGADDDAEHSVSIEEDAPHTADASFEGPLGAVVRLIGGRLKAPYEGDVRLVGDIALAELTAVFPGY